MVDPIVRSAVLVAGAGKFGKSNPDESQHEEPDEDQPEKPDESQREEPDAERRLMCVNTGLIDSLFAIAAADLSRQGRCGPSPPVCSGANLCYERWRAGPSLHPA